MELLLINQIHQIIYYGKCKTVANTITNSLIITPDDKNFEVVYATFEQDMIQKSKLLFVFASTENDSHDLILIFPKAESCNKIFKIICHKAKKSIESNEKNVTTDSEIIFQHHFFYPLCSEIHKNELLSFRLKDFMINLLNLFSIEQKQKYLILLKEKLSFAIYSEILKVFNDDKQDTSQRKIQINDDKVFKNIDNDQLDRSGEESQKKLESKLLTRGKRKAKMSSIVVESSDENELNFSEKSVGEDDGFYSNDTKKLSDKSSSSKRPKISETILNEIVETPQFQVLNYELNGESQQKLLTFPNSERKLCHIYNWYPKRKYYICLECRKLGKFLNASIFKKFNGEEYIKLNIPKHFCEPVEYQPEKYAFDGEKQIVKAPNFEIISFEVKEKLRKRLFIFIDAEKKSCYEYHWHNYSRRFVCSGCILKNKTTQTKTTAVLCHEKDGGDDFIRLNSIIHVCEVRKYEPEKYIFDDSKQIIKKLNFEILDFEFNGVKQSKLFIFLTIERKLCYIYNWQTSCQYYVCMSCKRLSKFLCASLCKNETNSEDYIKLNNPNHVCEKVEYPPEKYVKSFDPIKQIVKAPNFEIITFEERGTEKKRLIIFIDSERKLCYEYGWQFSTKKYICLGCISNKRNVVGATLCDGKNGEDKFVRLDSKDHTCQLRKFVLEKYKFDADQQIIKAPNFKILNFEENGKPKKRLFIFSEIDERKLGYEYFYDTFHGCFVCCGCISKKNRACARIITNHDGKDIIKLNKVKHICELREYDPQKYSPNRVVVNFPAYQIFKYTQKNIQKTSLFIFSSNDNDDSEKYGYEYYFENSSSKFRCCGCRMKNKWVTAKLIKYEDAKDHIELSNATHICEPRMYEPEKFTDDIIIYKPNYEIIERTFEGIKRKMLLTIIPENKDLCYEYYRNLQTPEFFYCIKCANLGLCIRARIFNDDDGNEYVSIFNRSHICPAVPYSIKKH